MSQLGQYVTPVGGGTITSLTGNAGGIIGPTVGGTINIVGAGGITVTGVAGTHTLTITGSNGFTWAEDPGPAVALLVAHGYILNNAGLITATLPAAAAVGNIIMIVGKGAGLYTIAQNAGQTIHFDDMDTTTGVGGSLTATNRYDCLELICTTINTDWVVRSSIGNFTVV